MATFQVKTDLPQATQAEIDRISAIASAQRSTPEANFLTARSDYLYNQILLKDGDLNISIAQGRTLPTGLSGFAVGAYFIKSNATTGENSNYQNVGTTSSASWKLVDGQITAISLTSAQIKALSTTPITLVSAQGAGTLIIVDEIVLKNTYGTATYTGGNALEFRYTDASGAKVSADIASTFINLVATGYAYVRGLVTALTPVANSPIVVRVPTADPAVGDGVITGFIKYHVVTL